MHFVITGPESSGKTTLFQALVQKLPLIGLEEQSRQYISSLNQAYTIQNITQIAKLHINIFNKYLNSTSAVLLDTDALTLKIWAEYKYGMCHPIIIRDFYHCLPQAYLICKPDISWEPDPQRENPFDRMELFELHLEHIRKAAVKYIVLEGSHETRILKAAQYLNQFINL